MTSNPIDSLTVREAIRSRPLAVGVLEEISGGSFWNRLDTPMGEFCRNAKVNLNELHARISSLPVNLERQDWKGLPLYFLVDHLTANHREFRRRDLPNIHRMLEALRLEIPSAQATLSELISELTSFRQEFSWHMEEEEEFLYPKILRTEASMRHPDLYPEIFKGSVTMFTKVQIHAPEDSFHALVASIFVRLKNAVSDISQIPLIQETLGGIQSFEARLRAHTYVESEILFPRATAMETLLLQRAAQCV